MAEPEDVTALARKLVGTWTADEIRRVARNEGLPVADREAPYRVAVKLAWRRLVIGGECEAEPRGMHSQAEPGNE